jgi:hypothetical protein
VKRAGWKASFVAAAWLCGCGAAQPEVADSAVPDAAASGFGGARVHLGAEEPAAVDRLAGLTLVIDDLDRSQSDLEVTKHWDPSLTASFDDSPIVSVLHGCMTSTAPIEIAVRACQIGAAGDGCLTLTFRNDGTVVGELVHPTGDTCEINGGSADIAMRDLDRASPPDPAVDVATGSFTLACAGAHHFQLTGTFGLRVSRNFLAC